MTTYTQDTSIPEDLDRVALSAIQRTEGECGQARTRGKHVQTVRHPA